MFVFVFVSQTSDWGVVGGVDTGMLLFPFFTMGTSVSSEIDRMIVIYVISKHATTMLNEVT